VLGSKRNAARPAGALRGGGAHLRKRLVAAGTGLRCIGYQRGEADAQVGEDLASDGRGKLGEGGHAGRPSRWGKRQLWQLVQMMSTVLYTNYVVIPAQAVTQGGVVRLFWVPVPRLRGGKLHGDDNWVQFP
jgi:hypothetical protein